MPWTIDDTRAQTARGIPPAAERKYEEWRADIHDNGTHPKVAAEAVRGLRYKELNGGHSQYEIRLNDQHRVTFTVDSALSEVRVYQIGGHT